MFGYNDYNFFAWEEDWMALVGSNFLFGHPHGAYPIPSVSQNIFFVKLLRDTFDKVSF